MATSTPVTSASTPVPHSPARHYGGHQQQHHHMVGLPVASTQYRSPYAVPQSSSGSSASTGFREAPPPPPPPLQPPQPPVSTNNYITHTLPVSQCHLQYSKYSCKGHLSKLWTLQPTVLTAVLPPQRSPQLYENAKVNGNGIGENQHRQSPSQHAHAPAMYSKYIQQSRLGAGVSTISSRSNGFIAVPSGDEMSTEL